jgi:hypothetical protein
MNFKNKIALTFFSFFFSVAVLYPSLVQFIHLFGEHEHLICSETATHIHGKKNGCEIHDFQLTSFDFSNIEYSYFYTDGFYIANNEAVNSFLSTKKIHTFLLRGPPILF